MHIPMLNACRTGSCTADRKHPPPVPPGLLRVVDTGIVKMFRSCFRFISQGDRQVDVFAGQSAETRPIGDKQ